MATILAHITVKPGCAARFEEILAGFTDTDLIP